MPPSVPPPQPPPAGWYANPGNDGLRWWDGKQWTEHVHATPEATPVTTTDIERDRAGIVGGAHDRLSAEARAVRIMVILVIGAALIYGGMQLTESATQNIEERRERIEAPIGY